MDLRIEATRMQGDQVHAILNTVPDECPICHRRIHPTHVYAIELQPRDLVQSVYRCTHQQCQELFIATYEPTGTKRNNVTVYSLRGMAPMAPLTTHFPDLVAKMTPSFVEVHSQSLAAEAAGLTQLVGIGLRKSLEFLIKDFAIAQHPDKEAKIKSTFLGKCIDDFVADPNVKQCAKRAAWLGNDETHYLRRWSDRDIDDLKRLVRLTVNWIDNVLLTQKYVDEMKESDT